MGLPSPPTSIHPLNHQASKQAPPQSHSSSRAPIESEVRILVQESSSTCTLWVPIQSTLWFLSQSTCTLWLVCSSRAPPMRKASPLHLSSLLPTIISEQSHLLQVKNTKVWQRPENVLKSSVAGSSERFFPQLVIGPLHKCSQIWALLQRRQNSETSKL